MRKPADLIPVDFAIGFGLDFAWVSSVFFQDSLFRAAADVRMFPRFYLSSMLVFILSLALFAHIASRHGRGARTLDAPGMFAAMAAATFLGTELAALSGFRTIPEIAAFALGAAGTGAGNAFTILLWASRLPRCGPDAARGLCAAFALATLLHFLLSLLPEPPFALSVSLLPVASLAFAWTRGVRFGICEGDGALPHARGRAEDGNMMWGKSKRPLPRGLFPKLASGAALFGFSLSLMLGQTRLAGGPSPQDGSVLAFFLTGESALIVMFICLTGGKTSLTADGRLALAYRVAILLMAGSLIIALSASTSESAGLTVMLVGYLCFKTVFWTLLAQIALVSGEIPVKVFGDGEAALAMGLVVGMLASEVLSLAIQPDELHMRVFMAMETALLLVVYLFVLTEQLIITVAGITERDDEPENHHHGFQERCADIAGKYGLSKREKEILMLFARGRSANRIAADLFISQGTVTTHLRNIYRKTDVHSRQELLDLLDGAVGEGGEAPSG